MDRTGADLDEAIQNIEDRLNCKLGMVQHLEMKDEEILSIVDLVKMERIVYLDDLGNKVNIEPVQETEEEYEDILLRRETLLETLADFNENIMEKVLEGEEVTPQELTNALKQAVQEFPQDFVIGMAGR